MANEKPQTQKAEPVRKVRITGNVSNAKGALKGIHTLPKKEAERLVRLGVAEFAGKDEVVEAAMTTAVESAEK